MTKGGERGEGGEKSFPGFPKPPGMCPGGFITPHLDNLGTLVD